MIARPAVVAVEISAWPPATLWRSALSTRLATRVGVMAFTNGASRAMLWLPGEVAGLLSHLLGVPDEAIHSDVPQHPEIWGDICGWYYLPGHLTDARARGMMGAGVEVFARHGQLIIRGLTPIPAVYRAWPLHPDDDRDPYVFRIDLSEFGIGTARVIFSREPGAATTAAHLDVVPLSVQKQPATKNPRLWATSALAVATTAIVLRRRATRRQHRMA